MADTPTPESRSLTLPTTSLQERKRESVKALASAISTSDAAKAAKRLIAQFPSIRTDNPTMFTEAVAAVLSQYPAGVVRDCLDPRIGLARKIEFFSIKSLTDWCDARQKHHEVFANYTPAALPPPRRIVSDQERAIASVALDKLFRWLRLDKDARGPAPTWQEAERELAQQK